MSATNLARRCVRLLDIRPDAVVALAITDAEVRESVVSLLGAAGAVVAPDEAATVADADAAIVELAEPLHHAVPVHARASVARVRAGGKVVALVHGVAGGEHPNRLAQHMAPMLDLVTANTEQGEGEGNVVIAGARRKQLTRDRRKQLKGIAHGLDATVLVGRGGLDAGVIAAAREAVERHGLIKVKLTPQSDLDKDEAADAVAWATGSQLVQRIGKVAVIFRPDVKLAPPGQPIAKVGRAIAKSARPSQAQSQGAKARARKSAPKGGAKGGGRGGKR